MTKPSGDELLQQVRQAIETYALLPSEHHATAITLWLAATHASPAWNTAPRLVIRAPEKRCGKTRLLALVEAVSHNPLWTVNASTPAVCRTIAASNGNPPTLCIDEADTIFTRHSENSELGNLLNVGHQRGRPALYWDAATRNVETLETFAMAALAAVGRLPDTIENRAVVIPMKRRAGGEHLKPYPTRGDTRQLHQFRQHLHSWVRSHKAQLADPLPQTPLTGPDADVWEPLLAIADLAQGNWPQQAATAAQTLMTSTRALHQ